jgi:hypothetical protein
MGTTWTDGFSAHVDLFLLVDGERLDVAQVGPSSFIFSKPVELPPGTEGELVISVDGVETKSQVLLQHGSRAEIEPVAYL